MILEIDAGNTFIKWRLVKADAVIARGQCLTASDAFTELSSLASPPEQIRIASVAGGDVKQRLLEALSDYGVTPHFARTHSRSGVVVNSYADPSRMGVDRWLAMLAAYQREQNACCVVDCGSAITVDYVAADGRHQGGFIIPGLRLMQRGLLSNTAEILVDQHIADFNVRPGNSTSEAVSHGINFMFMALVEKVVAQLQGTLYITGGDGELFHQLAGQGCWVPDLVLDGLRWEIE